MDKTPPKDTEAEKTLLSSLFIDPSMYYVVSGIVTEQSFYVTKHQKVFNAISSLLRDEIPIDLVSLSNKLDGLVSRSDIVEIANTSPTGANAEYHAKVIAEKHTRRRAIYTLNSAFNELYTTDDVMGVINNVQRELNNTLPEKRESSELYPEIYEIIDGLIDAHGLGEKPYISTGFYKLDTHTKIRPGQLTMVAADSGEGKTSFMLTLARNMFKKGKRPLFLTLEMTRRAIIENIISQELGLCHQDMIGGDLSEKDLNILSSEIGRFSNYNIGVLGGKWNVSEIRHQVITEHRERGVDCLMVDSLGKVKTEIKTDKPNIIFNEVCGELADIAEEFDIPVIVAHHLNKNSAYRSTNKRPTIDSLNEAGDRWTHNVLLIYREFRHTKDKDLEHRAEIIVGKARDGREGIIEVGFNGPSKSFYNLDEHHREPPQVIRGAQQWGN